MAELIRHLTSLYKTNEHSDTYFISFAYYDRDNYGSLRWTGDSESGEFTIEELYEFIKPRLTKESIYIKIERR